MLSTILYQIVMFVAKIHTAIMTWNDGQETVMTDKELHFWVIGIVGMGLLLVIYPLFKLLSKHFVLVIAWIYVFTVIIVLVFAIEIGQGLTGTGIMEFDDIVAGVAGFMFLFMIFVCIRLAVLGIFQLFKILMGK